MLRLILPLVVILAIASFAAFKVFTPAKQADEKLSKDNKLRPIESFNQLQTPEPTKTASPSPVSSGRVSIKQSDSQTETGRVSLPSPSSVSVPQLNTQIKSLEDSVADLKNEIASLKSSSSTTQTAATTKQAPVYIPLGSSDSSSTTDWTTVVTPQVEIDPADYPGYTKMYLEATVRVFQGNGSGYVRLFNNTDGLAILSSEISTTSGSYNTVVSGSFNLNSGKKQYRLQLKSLTGYEVSVQFARIKVVF